MSVVLGIDAAWTPHNPSGVALVQQDGPNSWRCIALAPSYSEFLSQTGRSFTVRDDCMAMLIEAAEAITREPTTLIAADIPLSTLPITARRKADNEISRHFGSRGCSAHSPTVSRPGRVSENLLSICAKLGFSLAVDSIPTTSRALIEVYPHPALLALMQSPYRVEYKTGKTRTYWPNHPADTRRSKLHSSLNKILDRLRVEFESIPLKTCPYSSTFSGLKCIEDQIDALVCAWIGVLALNGKATPLGDETAAIWVPSDCFLAE